jgi:hypothetical protein
MSRPAENYEVAVATSSGLQAYAQNTEIARAQSREVEPVQQPNYAILGRLLKRRSG